MSLFGHKQKTVEPDVIPTTVEQAIPIRDVCEDGIFLVGRNLWSKTYRFTDVNYATASKEDKEGMFFVYSEILNTFDAGAMTKITVNNRRLNQTKFRENNIQYQPKNAYCTAERVAFCNFVKGFEPPYSAIYQNLYREWIGAQIRADYYGYINPGKPEPAAEMAWRDASISHIKNGIYGEMFVAAMLAVAAVTNDREDILLSGLSQIPETSRLYEDIMAVFNGYRQGVSQNECLNRIRGKYDEYTAYGWCHTNPNAMIVAASLLYGNGDYGKSICMAVEAAFDTDCNGATVGSVLGMANGIESIPECWTKPIGNKLNTSIFGTGTVSISDVVKKTLTQI